MVKTDGTVASVEWRAKCWRRYAGASPACQSCACTTSMGGDWLAAHSSAAMTRNAKRRALSS